MQIATLHYLVPFLCFVMLTAFNEYEYLNSNNIHWNIFYECEYSYANKSAVLTSVNTNTQMQTLKKNANKIHHNVFSEYKKLKILISMGIIRVMRDI